ncbi:MAG: outer membrane protein transport protein [Muribaculaceae bacterium]|nr:outer membrane protein transport protein [Muribaculaceae bacterium]
MKKQLIILSIFGASTGLSFGQSAIGAYGIAQPDLKGTARFMGMAGAFGALGGDLSSLSQNPAGIGVYRSSDVGFTLDLDAQSSSVMNEGNKYGMDQTKFYLNNIGAVLTMRLPSKTFPNFNFGFTFNRGTTYNRVFGGNFSTLRNSMSNYIAGVANAEGVTEGDVSWSGGVDPYNPGPSYYAAPWLTVLGYDSYLMTPQLDPATGATNWYGLWDDYDMNGANTSGRGSFMMQESGSQSEFNIAFGGNISNVVYWGMNFDIINLNYNLTSIWGENLENALVPDASNNLIRDAADWNLNSYYRMRGTGFNYQFGLIFKPVQEFRLGFAFHTPTWFNINEEFGGYVNYNYAGLENGTAVTNDGVPGYNSYNLRTPWKIIASAAGVLGSNLIVSFDYEWANYGKMHFSEPNYYYDGGYDGWYDPWYPWDYSAPANYVNLADPYGYENADIATYYKSSNTFRVGVEFKPISALSIRAGYSYVSSPVNKVAKDNQEVIYTSGLTPSYRFDNDTNYITCGLGYRYSHFYVDLAYVYKRMNSEYHAYTPDPAYPALTSPQAKVSLNNSQVVLSMGYRF